MNGQMVAKKAKKKPAAKGGHHVSKKVTAKKESINDDSDQENENNEGIGHLKKYYHMQHRNMHVFCKFGNRGTDLLF